MALLMAGVLLLGLGCGEREDPTGPATLNITTTALPGAIAGRQYVGTLVAAGGERSYTWSVTVGGLPPGLVLHPSSGLISGTPTSIGFEDFTVEVGSGDGQSATRELMITVDPVLKPGELCSGHTGGSIAAFEDANVEAAVRSALEIGAQDDLTCGLLGTLKNLTAVNAGIVSLASIQNLTGLTTLDLPGNSITDISPLSGLTSLTVLVLGSNSITDISALTSLTSLTRIVLQDNPSLIDVQPLIDNPGPCPTHVVNLSSTNVSCADVAKLQVKGASVTSDCVSKIAFAFRDSWRQKFEIYVIDADGSNLVRLTRGGDIHSRYPAWSPDGSKIAFASHLYQWAPGTGGAPLEIYVMDADGSNPVRLTNDPPEYWDPAWSPDSSQIPFTSSSDGPCTFPVSNNCSDEVYVMDADGSNLVELTNLASYREEERGATWALVR